MSDDLRPPADEALKAYAARRRQTFGAPQTMPSHVRNRLHRELEQLPATEGAGGPAVVAACWRWLQRPWAWGMAVVLLAATLVIWRASVPPPQLATARTWSEDKKADKAGSVAEAERLPANQPFLEEALPPTGPAPVIAGARPVPTAVEPMPAEAPQDMAPSPTELSSATAKADAVGSRAGLAGASPANAVPARPSAQPSPALTPQPRSLGLARSPAPGVRAAAEGAALPPAARAEFAAAPAADAAKVVNDVTNAPAPAAAGFVAQADRFAPDVVSPQANFRQDARLLNLALNAFRLEQAGDRLQIVDEDGSIYRARLLAAGTPAISAVAEAPTANAFRSREDADRESRGSAPVLRKQETQATAPAVQFLPLLAEGTNRRSQQRVVFVGNLIVTNQAGTPALDNPQALLTNAAAMQFLISNARVEGQVTFGASNQFPLQALPTRP